MQKTVRGLTSFGPVVTRACLTEDKVVWTEQAAERSGANRIHRAGLEVDEHRARDILVRWKTRQRSVNYSRLGDEKRGVHTSSFVVIDINPFQLHVIGTFVPIKGCAGQQTTRRNQEYKYAQAIPFDTVLVRENLPEFGT